MRLSFPALVLGIGGIVVVLSILVIMATRNPAKDLEAGVRESTPIIQNAAYTVLVDYGGEPIAAGDRVSLRFRILLDGQPTDVFGAKRMPHVVIASEDYEDFLHTYSPIPEEANLFRVDHTFLRPGQYRIWVEIDHWEAEKRHGEHADLVAFVDLEVSEGDTAPAETSPSRTLTETVGGYTIHLSERTFSAGEEATWSLRVEQTENDALELFDIEPAIYVIVGPDFSFFRHGHVDGHHGQQNTEAVFTDTFPEAGEYLFWAELMVQTENDQLEVVPVQFILEVE
jgi:hypothetical protein